MAIQDPNIGLSSAHWTNSSELPAEIKPLDGKGDHQIFCGVSPVAVEGTQDTDPEIASDVEVMCMIFQASEQSNREFDSLKKQLAHQSEGNGDPIRMTPSTEPPISPRLRKMSSRAGTKP
jgi:hypothetical protein